MLAFSTYSFSATVSAWTTAIVSRNKLCPTNTLFSGQKDIPIFAYEDRRQCLLRSSSNSMNSEEHTYGRGTTLAGNYVVTTSSGNYNSGYSWSLFPIDQVCAAQEKNITADGAKAMDALHFASSASTNPVAVIMCEHKEGHLNVWVSSNSQAGETSDNKLFSVLQKIFVQWAAKQISSNSSQEWKVSYEGAEISAVILGSEPGVGKLFSSIMDVSPSQQIEWVEMVTGTGEVLGKVPRRLVHSFNLLHRGIGIFVTKDKPMIIGQSSEGDYPDLYVHRRAKIKRIFPSLYDMFVGGVSLAGEAPELTAKREVAEELGLTRALDDPNALSDPILVCVVCTAYNRCVVTLFSYTMNTERESVTWQEEEVDWGDFVPYPVIVAAADRSIQRLADDSKWPGAYPPIQSVQKGSIADICVSYTADEWNEWDFVPDGLLVWEAWLKCRIRYR